ncbi:NAD(P)-dependent oxidoreductase [Candidatus Woesearchaeota archaeon]|nr:NAD(P)-dependent oxidoreductase [Candidatus Woesearchaeota archaeon]
MKILITGANGYIGSNLVRKISENNNHEIYCIIRSAESIDNNLKVNWIIHDLFEPIPIEILPDYVDIIIHLAQSKHYKDFPDKALDIFNINCSATLTLLNYAKIKGVKKFIYSSSGGIYQPKEEAYKESDFLNPLNFYFTSKYIAERLVLSYSTHFKSIILRYFFVYGPNQQEMFIQRIINSIKEDKTIYIEGDEGLVFTPTYIDDAVNSLISAISLETSAIVNIGGFESISLKQLCNYIGDLLNRKPVFEYKAFKSSPNYIADTTNMKQLLGIKNTIPIKEGILKTIKSSIDH